MNMKTPEQILYEHGVLPEDLISSSAYAAIIKAMKAYAEQTKQNNEN